MYEQNSALTTLTANIIYYVLMGVFVAAIVFAVLRSFRRRGAEPQIVDNRPVLPGAARCMCCSKPADTGMPTAEAHWINSAANPHARRLYGEPPVVHLVERGPAVLCRTHYTAVYRLLEAFHSRQRARVLSLQAELASEAAEYENDVVIRQVRNMGATAPQQLADKPGPEKERV